MRYSTAALGAPVGSSFEVFGVDMLVDTDYRPWLVEVNAVPSLARKASLAPCRSCAQLWMLSCVQVAWSLPSQDSFYSFGIIFALVTDMAWPGLARKFCCVKNAYQLVTWLLTNEAICVAWQGPN